MIGRIGIAGSGASYSPGKRANIAASNALDSGSSGHIAVLRKDNTILPKINTAHDAHGKSNNLLKKMNIITRSREAILEIDQYPVFAGLGYKSSGDLVKESTQRGYRYSMQYIGKTAADGDRLAAIELGGEPLADIAERDAFPENDSGIGTVPGAGPEFDVKYITRMYKTDGTLVGTKVDRFI
ncbi:MAG TPA: DUF6470 family protein [Clostridiales bacterium]|nr:DUF6470 family protein [Clostridiales bacterium]